jgi:hypothetical protein
MAGYSGTPLAKKLGLKPGPVVVLNEPKGFRTLLAGLPKGCKFTDKPAKDSPAVLFFSTERKEVAQRLEGLMQRLAPDGMLWMAWPKKASGVATDLTEDVMRELALPLAWSTLKSAPSTTPGAG